MCCVCAGFFVVVVLLSNGFIMDHMVKQEDQTDMWLVKMELIDFIVAVSTQFLKYVVSKCFEKSTYVKKSNIRRKLCSLRTVLVIDKNSQMPWKYTVSVCI